MNEKLHFTQLVIIVFMIQSGVILFALPRMLGEAFGTNGWLALIGLGLIAFVNLYFIVLVYTKGKGKSVFEIVETSIPKFLFIPFYIYMIISFCLLAVLVAKNYVMLIQLTMFSEVNPNVFLVYFLLIIFYFLSKGIYTMGKISVICFFMTIWIPLLLILLVPEFSFHRLTTFIFQGPIEPINKGIDVYTAFLGYELTLFFIPHVQHDGKFGKAIVAGHFLTVFLYLFVCVFSMGFFSFQQLKNTLYPMYSIFKYIETPFIERIENFVLALYLLNIIVTVVFYYWTALEVSKRMFKKTKQKWLMVALFLVSFLVALVPDIQREVNEMLRYVAIPHIIFSVSFPLLLLFLIWFSNRWVKKNEDIA